MQIKDVIHDLSNEGKVLYISGFANPKLRTRAQVNTKPFKVQLKLYSEFGQVSANRPEHLVAVLFDRDDQPTRQRFDMNGSHELFDTEYEAIEYYNSCVQKVLDLVDVMYEKIEKNKL